MSISTQCTHCKKRWKLKDELAGKRIKCPNPDCAKPISVPATAVAPPPPDPTPLPAPVSGPYQPPEDTDSLAASFFNEEPGDQNKVPEDLRTIDVLCPMCDHKWVVPFAQQGKNVLCPECKHRQKVPEVKKVAKIDWRDPKADRPSMAKGPDIPEDLKVQQSTSVNIDSLVQAGAIPEAYIEPVPLKIKLLRYGLIVAIIFGLIFAYFAWRRSSGEKNDDKLLAETSKEIEGMKEEAGISKAQVDLTKALMHAALIEASVRGNTKERLTLALSHYAEARKSLMAIPTTMPEYFMVLNELALATLTLGGTDAQIEQGIRIYWKPPPPSNKPRLTGDGDDVQKLLGRQIFQMLQASDFDTQISFVRRLKKAAAKYGQGDLLNDIFGQAFPDEANKSRADNLLKAPAISNDEAIAKARGTAKLADRLSELAGAAESVDDPKPMLEAATELLDKAGAALPTIAESTKARFALLAANANLKDAAEKWIKNLKDEGLKAWMNAEILRGKAKAAGKAKVDANDAERPADPRVGHAMGCLIVARHNTAVSGDKKSKSEYEGWKAPYRSLGLTGYLLGMQDHQGK